MQNEQDYVELLDLRTHLTVALLASSQLKRKSAQTDEFVRLYCYLDRSLMQMQGDITELESLVRRLQDEQHPAVSRARRFPPQWIGMGLVFLAARVRRNFVPQHPLAMQNSIAAR